MNNFTKLTIAALLSGLGMYATHLWYESQEPLYFASSLGKPVATLKRAVNTVQRRPQKRLLWQPVKQGNILYKGDTIRTLADARGTVRLNGSNIEIFLDPDSLITLEKTKEGVTLDLLSGNLDIKKIDKQTKASKVDKNIAEESQTGGLTIKSGSSKIEIVDNKTELSLGVDKAGKTSVTVSRGEARVESVRGRVVKLEKGKSGEIGKRGSIKKAQAILALFPKRGAVVDLGQKSSKTIKFRFSGIEDKKADVFLELGNTKETLQQRKLAQGSQTGTASINIGDFYWRVLAMKSGQIVQTSDFFKATGVSYPPPEILSPSDGGRVVLKKKKKKAAVVFDYLFDSIYSDGRLEVSRNKNFKKSSKWKVRGNNSKKVRLSKGSYYVRLSGVNSRNKIMRSKVHFFRVENAKPAKRLTVLSPEVGKIFALTDLSRASISWQPRPMAESYLLELDRSEEDYVEEFEVNSTKFPLKSYPLGQYKYRIRSIDKGNLPSLWTVWRKFEIVKPPVQKLAFLNLEKGVYYYDGKPKMVLKWKDIPAVKKWRLRYSRALQRLVYNEIKWMDLDRASYSKNLSQNIVKYYAEVEGFDEDKNKLAVIDRVRVRIEARPLLRLPAPVSRAGQRIVGKASGKVKVSWAPVEGAKQYIIEVYEVGSDEVVETKNVNGEKTSVVLRKMLPGDYLIRLATVNKADKVGKKGRKIAVTIPAVSNIAPPSVGVIQVE